LRRNALLGAVVLAVAGSLGAMTPGEPVTTLRIGLSSLQGARRAEIEVGAGEYRLVALGRTLAALAAGQRVALEELSGGRIAVSAAGAQRAVPSLRLEPATRGSFLTVRASGGRRRLQGALECSLRTGLFLINELPVEEYLRGVVPAEMFPSWEMEALKCQAILARTYIVGARGDRHQGFDLCDQSHCQVYLGLDEEHERTTQAVRQTAGQILTYGGRPARIFYHSTCGGVTAAPAEVFQLADLDGVPAQRAVSDQSGSRILCSISPHFHWEFRVEKGVFQTFLQSLALGQTDPGRITKIRILERDPSGRVNSLEMVGTRGSFRLSGYEFRSRFVARFGGESLKSTLFTISVEKDKVVLRGRGFGHGVGLCQWGAEALAQQGVGYRDILQHYYPQSRLGSLLALAAGD
jgi:stage II sporulation protein D (peptidoglycan lytic transglycosylase)